MMARPYLPSPRRSLRVCYRMANALSWAFHRWKGEWPESRSRGTSPVRDREVHAAWQRFQVPFSVAHEIALSAPSDRGGIRISIHRAGYLRPLCRKRY